MLAKSEQEQGQSSDEVPPLPLAAIRLPVSAFTSVFQL
jgi:hypothetical protein